MSQRRKRKKREQARGSRARQRHGQKPDRLSERELLTSWADKARQVASGHLRRDDLAVNVLVLADEIRALALRGMERSPLSGRHECQPGCDPCCHTAVTVAAPEAFAIVQHLQTRVPPDALREVRDKMDRNATLASSMTREAYIAELIPCALRTEDGNCCAHPVRPIACAGFLSTSRAKCLDEFNRVPDRDPVPTDPYAMIVGLGVSHGLSDACKQAGLDGTFYELHHALRRVMDTRDPIDTWVQGDRLFEGCLQ